MENSLEVNIVVYESHYEDNQLLGIQTRRSVGTYPETVNVLRYGGHICYLDSLEYVFKAFRCVDCGHFSKTRFNYERHIRKCVGKVVHIYPGRFYRLKETIFERLAKEGIDVPSDQQKFTNLAVYDFESYTTHDPTLINTHKLSWEGKHIPICVSLTSNLHQDATFIFDKDPQQLVDDFVSEVDKIALHSKELMMCKFSPYLSALEDIISTAIADLTSGSDTEEGNEQEGQQEEDGEEENEDEEEVRDISEHLQDSMSMKNPEDNEDILEDEESDNREEYDSDLLEDLVALLEGKKEESEKIHYHIDS